MVTVSENVANSESLHKGNGLEGLSEKKIIAKSELRRIETNELPSVIPDYKNSETTKDNLVSQWLINWIEQGLNKGKLKKGNLLPKKSEIAKHIKVSVGTVQNAIRFIEDKGYVESKQRIGTLIRDYNEPVAELRKQTSKREQAIVALKKWISSDSCQVGSALPSSRELAKIIGSASNTTRLALEHLASCGIIDSKGCRGNKANWILAQKPQIDEIEAMSSSDIASDTLVNQVERDLKEYIVKNCEINGKLPPHFDLSKELKVSIKTVHDAMRRLIEQGILRSRRGRYGTTILRMPSEANFQPQHESSIFASAADASMYNYEKVEKHLKQLIKSQYKIGDKLPAMGNLAKELNVSSNTIRKALQKLSDQHIVKFSRGRYGGTFIINAPEVEETSAFTWLSVNPEHIAAYR